MIPEVDVNLKDICDILKKKYALKQYGIVAVAEGAVLGDQEMITKDLPKDEFGHVILGGISERLAKLIEKETGFETRNVVLGHLQRGGATSAYDRYLGLRFGSRAIELIEEGDFGKMVALKGNEFVPVAIKDAVAVNRTVEPEEYDACKLFFS